MTDRFSEDGYFLDEYDREWGYCNACGDEALAGSTCCDDGEVVPDART